MHFVTLIHGTFARNAQWTQEGSRLRTGIVKSLEPSTVIFECFDWSGKNSVRAREKAAAELQRFLRERLARFPTATHSIIAHSHGGNIALRALEGDSELRQQVPVIVTLATPFVAASLRDTTKWRFALSLPVKLVLWGLVIGSPLGIIQLIAVHQWIILLILLGEIVFAGLVYGLMYAGKQLANEFQSQAQRQLLFWKIGTAHDLDLLVIRPPADEASLTLNFLQTIIFAGTIVWEFPITVIKHVGNIRSGIDAWFERNRVKYYAATAVLGLGLSIAWLIAAWPTSPSALLLVPLSFALLTPIAIILLVSLLSVFLMFVTGALAVLACALSAPVYLLAAFANFPFGFFDIFTSPFLKVTVEPAPPGGARIFQLPSLQVRGLMHSLPYEDPDSICAAALWLRGETPRSAGVNGTSPRKLTPLD